MDPNKLEKLMRQDQRRIASFHAIPYAKRLLRHLLWITIGVIVLILLTIIVIQFLYDSVRLTSLFLLLFILITLGISIWKIRKKRKNISVIKNNDE